MAIRDEEKDLIASYEGGDLRSVLSPKQLKRYQKYAKATFAKDRRVNIRISSKILEGLQLRAIEEGIPYQTLIASVLHKFVAGTLVDSAHNNRLHGTLGRKRSSRP